MKKMSAILAAYVVMAILAYLFISFYFLSLDPHNWNEFSRFLYVMLNAIWLGLTVVKISETIK